jgi:hypothetical protein
VSLHRVGIEQSALGLEDLVAARLVTNLEFWSEQSVLKMDLLEGFAAMLQQIE